MQEHQDPRELRTAGDRGRDPRVGAAQFVRKLSGTSRPSKANEEVFNRAVEEVTASARRLIAGLQTTAPPKDREIEAQKARERSAKRFA